MSSTIALDLSTGVEQGAVGPFFPVFLDHLRLTDLSEKNISDASGQARNFLVCLEEVGGGIETIDDTVVRRFRDHDCRCPPPRRGQYGNTPGGRGRFCRVCGGFWCSWKRLEERRIRANVARDSDCWTSFLNTLREASTAPSRSRTTGASAGISSFGSTCPGS